MHPDFLRRAVLAILALYARYGSDLELGSEQLQKTLNLDLGTDRGVFGTSWRLANGARTITDRVPASLRVALLSIAIAAYDDCVRGDDRFRKSLEQTRASLRPHQVMNPYDALKMIEHSIIPLKIAAEEVPTPKREADESVEQAAPDRVLSGNLDPSGAPFMNDEPPTITEVIDNAECALETQIHAHSSQTLRDRFDAAIRQFSTPISNAKAAAEESVLHSFEKMIQEIMKVADAGRTFTEFAPLEQDLAELRPFLRKFPLAQSELPRQLQDRAKLCRRVAESVNFASAAPEDYHSSRLSWLLSAYWNSYLQQRWPTNRPNVVYDFLGYLTVIQAEYRYSDADFLLLLRVCFSICRIASHDGLIPLQVFTSGNDRLNEWLRYTVGIVLASAGPDRVPPSRVPFDRRLSEDRRSHGETLLRLWTSDRQRAAASTLLLEMGAWDETRAVRILQSVIPSNPSLLEIWCGEVQELAELSKRVRVVRPNPWAPGSGKPITVEGEAVAVLAADVVDRNYRVLGRDISLRGHEFRSRRVPTYVCLAEFGPLGLFKLDTAERVRREVENFARYAERLHPRYRASRCDSSMTVITEPDDDKQFIQGALTSYVFTDDESPRTLNEWFLVGSGERALSVCEELFDRALRPWYGHATSATIDLLEEFPIFTQEGLARLRREGRFADVQARFRDESMRAVEWVGELLNYLDGVSTDNDSIARIASELQIIRSYRSVVHGDLHLDNILVVGKPGAEYPCVIDFEATHVGYVLKDFGRFVSSVLLRTHSWSEAEIADLIETLPPVLLDWGTKIVEQDVPKNAGIVFAAIVVARKGMLRSWQAGALPGRAELIASLVASLLPFARYPDTSPSAVNLCLRLASRLISLIDA